MAIFQCQDTVDDIRNWEGGIVNDPQDPGGLTAFGLSQREYPSVNLLTITFDEAMAIYKRDFWDKLLLDQITNQPLAEEIFDTGVNMGQPTAVRLLQEASAVTVDGIIGPNTIAAANRNTDDVHVKLMQLREAHYNAIVAAHPQEQKFLTGWIRRAEAVGQETA